VRLLPRESPLLLVERLRRHEDRPSLHRYQPVPDFRRGIGTVRSRRGLPPAPQVLRRAEAPQDADRDALHVRIPGGRVLDRVTSRPVDAAFLEEVGKCDRRRSLGGTGGRDEAALVRRRE
ncbi:MAG: hypothetical protein ACK56I_02300, partial [bacterium]